MCVFEACHASTNGKMAKNRDTLDRAEETAPTVDGNPCLDRFQADPYGKSRFKKACTAFSFWRSNTEEFSVASSCLRLDWLNSCPNSPAGRLDYSLLLSSPRQPAGAKIGFFAEILPYPVKTFDLRRIH